VCQLVRGGGLTEAAPLLETNMDDIDWDSIARNMWDNDKGEYEMDNGHDDNIHFPATFAGMTQRASGEIVLKFELDASQMSKIQALGSDWLDKGLLIAITTSDEETVAG
jgi:hypothetical protein